MSKSFDQAAEVLGRPIERAFMPLTIREWHQGKCWRCDKPNGKPETDHTCEACLAFISWDTDIDPRTGRKAL